MTDLSKNEFTAKELMPATSTELSEAMNVSRNYVYDIMYGLREKGLPVRQNTDGEYFIEGVHQRDMAPNNVGMVRSTSGSDATITRKVRKHLAEMEYNLKSKLQDMEPAVADGGHSHRSDAQDFIIHRTDDHFGELVENQNGDVVFNSEIARDRVNHVFDEAMGVAECRRDMGVDFDNAHLLMGGDIVTNENIYNGQSHEIDSNLREQIEMAAETYLEGIRRLSDAFPAVQVVGQVGNHGEIRTGNSSNAANADGILYAMLDKIIRESDMDNVSFLRNDMAYYIDFRIRDWNAHLRHGHDSSLEHIGTSAGKQRWLQWLVDHDFDVAFRGHYHVYKEEPIAGRPVHMGGSIVPQTQFEESMALSGKPISAVHGSTDRHPTEWTEKIVF